MNQRFNEQIFPWVKPISQGIYSVVSMIGLKGAIGSLIVSIPFMALTLLNNSSTPYSSPPASSPTAGSTTLPVTPIVVLPQAVLPQDVGLPIGTMTLPSPLHTTKTQGTFRLTPQTRIVVDERDQEHLALAKLLQSELKTTYGLDLLIQNKTSTLTHPTGDIILNGIQPLINSAESYTLTVKDHVVIQAGDIRGLFYGTRTLRQLLTQEGQILAGREIVDKPKYTHRMFVLDALGFGLSVDQLKGFIRLLSDLKFNRLKLIFGYSNGWYLESKRYPELASAGHLTHTQMAEVINYAKSYHMDIVPGIDFPGSDEYVIKKFPELSINNFKGEPSEDSIDITNPKVIAFVTDIMEEILTLFPSKEIFFDGNEFLSPVPQVSLVGQFDGLYPQLSNYAKKKFGDHACGVDALISFYNDMNLILKKHNHVLIVENDRLTTTASIGNHDPLVGSCATWLDKDIIIGFTVTNTWGANAAYLAKRGNPLLNGNWGNLVWHANLAFPENLITPNPDLQRTYEYWQPNLFSDSLDRGVFKDLFPKTPNLTPDDPALIGAYASAWGPKSARDTQNWQQKPELLISTLKPWIKVLAQKFWGTPPATKSYKDFIKNTEKL